MFFKPKPVVRLFLSLATVYFYNFQFCSPVSLGRSANDSVTHEIHESASTVWKRTEQDTHKQQSQSNSVQQVTRGTYLYKKLPSQLQAVSTSSPEEPLRRSSAVNLDKSGDNFTLNSSSWIVGNVRAEPREQAPDSDDGYQGDFTGFPEVKGKVLGLSADSSPHFFEWEAMKPLVECDAKVMIFTASGQGFTHLQVDRNGASPISVFQLPSYCGYTVKASWSELEIMVPYDGCYIIQENDSYVLPMQWLGSPLKLSCPTSVASPALSPSFLSVSCSHYGMAVKIRGDEKDLPVLGVLVNEAWSPFVSELCGLQIDSQPQEFTFFVSYSAPCVTVNDGLHLHLILDDQEYVLSCPVIPQLLYAHSPPQSPLSPGEPQFFVPDPAIRVPVSPTSQTSNQETTAQLSNYHPYPFPGLLYHQLPQVDRPAPQSSHPPQPTHGSSESQQQRYYPSEPASLSNLQYPPHYHFLVWGHSAHEVSKLPGGSSQLPAVWYHPHLPYFYMASSQTTKENPAPSVVSTTQSSATPPLPSSQKQPVGSQHQTNPLYLQVPYNPHLPVSNPASHPSSPPSSPTASTSGSSSQFYFQSPFHFPLPTDPPSAREKPQKPATPQGMCQPSSDSTCSDNTYPSYPNYPVFYPPHHQQLYPHWPYYPNVQPSSKIPSTSTNPPWLTPQTPHLQCLEGRMAVFLPFADPESIQVRDLQKKWVFLSSVSPICKYMVQRTMGHGVILHSPLPACHSELQPPTTVSFPIQYWDFSVWQNRTWDLQCPYQSIAKTPAPATPPPSSTTKDKTSPSLTEVFCSFQQMTVMLPHGPISEMAVKDIKGNQMNLLEAPKDCGYYANEGKDGRIHLILQLHPHCHMSVQGDNYIITVIYMTESGRKEAQFSCPVVAPRSGHECNLHSEYRLPCGSSSITQTECLSMGCCFNKHPPACYYPMDECTIDRRMIFSVPASLTEPPLSPALLVAANNSTCKPQRTTSEYALFNIPMDGCGTRRVVVGKTVVYMVEIINMIQAVSLNYGTITRDSPVRLLVECRYVPGTTMSVSYVVKTPTLGPEIHTQGVFGVQLRIAKDADYSSYYPQYHQPLHMLVGKPLHLEVQLLNSPDPSLVLLVHFCVAYPRSGKAVWVLLYNGCPNPLDPAPPKTVLSHSEPSSPQSQTRRFTISTFQFLPDDEFQDMDEEIYFMCSTEICSPQDGPCVEGCFGH
ncbi:uncharacterized protein LOC121639097 [Melanotaenia boesemani]|uniref:uncharacterized protein LOC121639097 n=1 Tax=Melanotaenia boesemani TaxID=1250792 RepID=UPI001C03F411|nr:uncharacterized protein LOC121639097 [Melanotaenia boesemani]XP_041840230.1 uncharacterized protein LOC121639097 [Melanotaenia boesemani]